MSSTRLFVILVLILSIFLLQSLHEVQARGARGGGARGGSRRTPSSRNTRRRISNQGASRVTSKTPLRVTTYRSNIIKSQAKNPSYPTSFRQRFIAGALLGALVYRYGFSNGRTYAARYSPYHSSNVIIPRQRALRLQEEAYSLETENGKNCTFGNLTEDYENRVLDVTTKVSYTTQNTSVMVSNPNMATVILSNALGEVFVETRTLYNGSVIQNGTGLEKNCTVMFVKIRGYIVIMYDTNPNSACCNANHFAITIFSFIVFIYLSW